MVHLLQAADVWSPVQDLRHDAWPSLLPADAPLGAGAVQLICMLVSLRARGTVKSAMQLISRNAGSCPVRLMSSFISVAMLAEGEKFLCVDCGGGPAAYQQVCKDVV